MARKKKSKLGEERKLRNISDYIFDCTSRLLGNAELLEYLAKHKNEFASGTPKQSFPIIISLFDVYSRDSIITLMNILDEDTQTSSLFTLVDHIKDEKTKKRYSRRLFKIKEGINGIVRARHNHIAHFNTDLNIHENGYSHINIPAQFSPRYLKKITKKISLFRDDVTSELGVEGLFMSYRGSIVQSFVELVGKRGLLRKSSVQ